MTGETADSDFYGIVLNAAAAAMDGCPWVEKGRVTQIADGIAETVTDRLARVHSVHLPDGQRFECCTPPSNQHRRGDGEVASKVAEAMFARHARGQDFDADLREHDEHTQTYWDGIAEEAAVLVLASLEATLLAHRPYGLDCKCDRPINSDADWARHVVGVLGEDTGK